MTSSVHAVVSAYLNASLPTASCVAHSRVPKTAPSHPSAKAAARPRPSTMPPAASTVTSLLQPASDRISCKTRAAKGKVERPNSARRPWPPASRPCTTTQSTPARSASRAACSLPICATTREPRLCASLTFSPPSTIAGAKNCTAMGRCSLIASATLSSPSFMEEYPMNPIFKGVPSGTFARKSPTCSRSADGSDKCPAPMKPSAPARQVAAASNPPDTPAIGAPIIGMRHPNCMVKRVHICVDAVVEAAGGGILLHCLD
mmetsp:Transcript_33012/g.72551  ORF Transcript_33012/g.72551 Transcript_33012/m.72551 type:complete len:260 (-) Transcript_33012:163-942(-)